MESTKASCEQQRKKTNHERININREYWIANQTINQKT